MTNAILIMVKTLVWTDMKMQVSCMFQLPGGWPAQSGTMMEGGMQLLNRDGHSISHNSKRHYHDSFVSMNRMRQRGLLCDIVLHVSNKEIKAHKVVLASCSPYFHAMFTSKLDLWIALLASCFPLGLHHETVSSYFSFLLSWPCLCLLIMWLTDSCFFGCCTVEFHWFWNENITSFGLFGCCRWDVRESTDARDPPWHRPSGFRAAGPVRLHRRDYGRGGQCSGRSCSFIRQQ